MSRIHFVVLCLMFGSIAGAAVAAEPPSRPNVLLIVGDDMGYADVGFQGCRDIRTPHLDQLAADGMRFTNGYVTGPYCSPTRAGLLTGRYQTRFGHEYNPGAGDAGLPLSETTIAQRLRATGYQTGLVGKWHLGGQEAFHPQQRGFAEFFGFLGGAHDYFQSAGILRGMAPAQEKDYLTDALGREASAFIERHRSEPWFLYLSFNAVHTPMQADDARLAKYAHITDSRRRTYAAMMAAMDDAVGRVRKTVADLGLAQNTLVLFISDNGGPTMPGVTVNGSLNTPLRGSKRTTLEGGIRVPFVVAWPGRVPASVFESPVIQLDLTATILAAAQVQAPADPPLDGVDLLPYVTGKQTGDPHHALYWRFGQQMAIRAGDYKLVRYDVNADTLTGAGNQGVTSAKLYNLREDIGEMRDLSGMLPDKVRSLQSQWETWNADNVPSRWGNDPTSGGGAKAKKKKQKQK